MFYERSCFIFDLDGTLIDSLGVWSQVDQELMRRLSNGRVMLSEDEAGTLRIRAMKTYGEGSDAYLKGLQSSSNTSRHSVRSSQSLPQLVGATLMFMPLRTNR